ncbi:MAG: YdcF family protein [Hyphomicrobium sp.]|uniref:YdcF family protein n=1 Tax=Hyphomicrobium sp. TaxID=82 RepID=UPI0013235E7E|nr:YdcF family protein [Hyphomicrobium sp.]KAB2939820.1 MAG: YdcF family protein [Hyphomicrobium sp.]MBZ0208709.1 YdcF family protein [Hyphomicrobium sp.]MCZ7596213.1 YdcF family protein [Hyphomicrobium sp.]
MSSLRRIIILGTAAAVSLLALGFVLFASVVTRLPAQNNPHADGIVVLTGEGRRIAEGARLLDEGRAQRMLISGVFRRTGKKALIEISGLPEDKFDCCVDVGYAALDTAGNANETRAWAASHGYDSLIVVTASYHMPRSLAELSLALPSTQLIPHPVVPNNFPPSRWWLNASVTRTLISEYFKFLPTAAHLTVARLLRSTQQSSVAEVPAGHSAAGIF